MEQLINFKIELFKYLYLNFGIFEDKILHFFVSFFIVGIFVFLINQIKNKKNNFKKNLLSSFILISIIGLSKEILDYFSKTGNSQITDLFANYLGFLFFFLIYFIVLKIQKLILFKFKK